MVHHTTVVCLPYDVCHRVSTVESIPYSTVLMVVVPLSSGHTYRSVCRLYSCVLHSGFHCGIHSTAVPGFVDSIVMNFSIWGRLL